MQEFLEGKLKELDGMIEKRDEKIESLIKESVTQAVEKSEEEGKKISDSLKDPPEAGR